MVLTDKNSEGNFTWISGEPVTYTNWHPNEPNDAGGNEDYASMNVPGWNDIPDTHSTFYGIVETVHWYEYNGKRYTLTSNAKTWEEAQLEARKYGGNLVTINNAQEEQWLQSTFGTNRPYWIGLTDKETEGDFKWINSEPVNYLNWTSDNPNNAGGNHPLGDQDYAVVNYSITHQWDDEFGTGQYFGIIEVDSPLPLTNQATGGIDYTVTNGTLTFNPGETTKTITVPILGDVVDEDNERFFVNLSGAVNGNITDSQGIGIINDNDNAAVVTNLAITATNANRPEGNGWSTPFTFTVNRSGSTSGSNTVNWTVTVTGTNPANATDFVGGVLPSGTVSFAAGETSKVITVRVKGDTIPEPNETFRVTLSNPNNGATITTATATGTIQNDDGNVGSGSTFTGTSANNTLNGTTVADTLIGLAGNDTYTVNNNGDMVVENPNEGIDTVRASITYTLPNNVENLILTGTANLNGTGNALKNKLTGNSGNNTLTGLAGNDALDGKAGADTLIGGLGNDTYTVDNIGDVVVENPNEGTDTIRTSISYTLPNNVENLTLTGSAHINGTGNILNNRIVGNSGNNILNGGAGRDTLTGKGGNDIFVFQFGQSTVTTMNRITDFAIGADKIDLLTQSGASTGKPWGLTRAADSNTTNINTIVGNVFADANGATAGNQALGTNRAALVKANTATYLIVNDQTAGFQSTNDLVINLTGITGLLPAFGSIPVGNFFI